MATTTTTDLEASIGNRSRVAWGIRAAAALIIGILVLVNPAATINILAVLLGIYFIILGLLRVIQGVVAKDLNGGGRVANLVIGGLILAAGVVVVRNPFETAVFVVILVGISWIFEGIATLVDTARGNRSGISVVIGLLITIAGILVIVFADGVTVAYAIFFGITLIAVAILDVVLLVLVGGKKD